MMEELTAEVSPPKERQRSALLPPKFKIWKQLIGCLTAILISLSGLASAATDDASVLESVSFYCSDWPPFEYQQPDGTLTGYSVEILTAMYEQLGIPPKIQLFPWNRSYQSALNNTNTAVFTLARTADREKLFQWVGPIADREVFLWKLKSREDIHVASLEDAKKYLVGTVRGEAGEQQLLSKGFQFDVNIHSVDTQSRNFLLLFNNRIDFFYGLELTTFFILKKEGYNPYEVEKAVLLSGGQQYYFGFNRETPEHVVRRFQDALQQIKDNGTFERIQRKYGITPD